MNENYKKYIDNLNISKCLKKNILNYNKKNIYNNNNLLYTLKKSINELEDYNKYFYYYKFIEMFQKFIGFKNSINFFNLISENKNDEYLIKLLLNYKKNNDKTFKFCNSWEYFIEIIFDYYKNFNNKNIKYLDICSGNGKKTYLFHKIFNIDKNNVFTCDINNWGSTYDQNKIKHEFNFNYIENNKLNYDDNSFDLITIILSLHHIEKIDIIIQEIYRVLKPNGYVIIIEHDNYNDIDNLIVIIQHLLFATIYDKNLDYIKNPYYYHYYNRYELDYLFNNNNLKMIYTNYLFEDNKIRYDNLYYSIYQKK
jgi:ubiquinone/menaquinone biosynthesis C-methylase UbiE